MEIYSLAVILHVIGAVLGVGSVTVNDLQYYRAIGDKELGIAFQKSAHFYGQLIKTGLSLLVASGIYFLYIRPAFFGSEKIVTKLVLVGILILNGMIINFILEKKFHALKAEDWGSKSQALKNLVFARLPFDIISIVSWYGILILGAAGRQPWKAFQISIVYIILLIISYLAARYFLRKKVQA